MTLIDELETASRVLARAASGACLLHKKEMTQAANDPPRQDDPKHLKDSADCSSVTAVLPNTVEQPVQELDQLENASKALNTVDAMEEIVLPAGSIKDERAAAESINAWSGQEQIKVQQLARKVYRLIMLYWQVMIEYFQRTGENATGDAKHQQSLRKAVSCIASDIEMQLLYPQGNENTHCNPSVVLFWLKCVCSRLAQMTNASDHTLTATNGTLGVMDTNFSMMEDIDKN
jgi:hypothetical protein